jgi:DNA primase
MSGHSVCHVGPAWSHDHMTAPAPKSKLAEKVSLLQLLDPAITQMVRAGLARTDCPHCKQHATMFATTLGYRCDACDAAGDIVSFQMAHANVTHRAALEQLALRGGLADTSEQWNERVAAATFACDTARKWYREQFDASPTVQGYWLARGFTLADAQREGIGYAPAESARFLEAMRAARVPNTALFDSGLMRSGSNGSTYAFMRDRILFPITDVDDVHAIGFGGRRLLDPPGEIDEGRKYLNTPSSVLYAKRSVLYGLGAAREAIRDKGEAIVVEGFFARLRLVSIGIANVVAVNGTALTSDHAALLEAALRPPGGKKKVTVTIFFDDGARDRAIAAARQVAAAGMDVRIAEVPPGADDPDTLGRGKGGEAVRKCLSEQEAPWLTIVRQRGLDPAQPIPLGDRRSLYDAILDYLNSTKSTYDKGKGTDAVAAWFGIPRATVVQHLHAMMAPPTFPGTRNAA